jgi:hypothetical protein
MVSKEGFSANMRVTVVSLVVAVLVFLVAIFLMLPPRASSKNAGCCGTALAISGETCHRGAIVAVNRARGGDKLCYGLAYVLRSG